MIVLQDEKELSTDLAENSPIFINGEVDALEKIVFNYLSNAIKFSPKGGAIEFGISQLSGFVRIFVKDQGPGLSNESQEKLFKVFAQLDNSTTREHEGTGLGLALVKELTEAMQGRVGIESELGKGSNFWIELPIVKGISGQVEEGPFIVREWLLADVMATTSSFGIGTVLLPPELSPDSPLILVVDDIADMRQLIAYSLQSKGYRTTLAANGEEALALAPDLVLTDWMMPKVSGPDLIKRMRQDPKLANTPVILLTAKSDEDSLLLGADIGATAFLSKPFNEAELISIVRNLVQLKEQERKIFKLNQKILEQTEKVMRRYLPLQLVKDIIEGRTILDDRAKTQNITVLFSDLVGFTKASEKLGPQKMSQVLNEFLSEMVGIIFAHQGTLDKFIGDGIMILFGAPQSMSVQEQVWYASDCAYAMQEALDVLNQKWEEEGIDPFYMRIGIHTGPAIVGTFGNEQRSEYTAIGSTVNIA